MKLNAAGFWVWLGSVCLSCRDLHGSVQVLQGSASETRQRVHKFEVLDCLPAALIPH